MTLDDLLAGTQPQVIGTGYGFTEGPAADAQGNVYFSDGQNNSIHYYEVGKPVVLFTDQSTDAIGMMISGRGELCVCEGAAYRVVAYDVQTKHKRVLCDQIDGQHFNEPNDLAIDHSDGFYFSDPNYQHRGQPTVMKQDVYYCSAAGAVNRVSTVCFKPNGVLLSADDRTLFVADARGQRIYRYDVHGPGQLAGERIWIDGLRANPDGMTLDEHENLYVCCGKAGVKIFDRAGQFIGLIPIHTANACFGGPDFKTLFLASVDKFLGLPMRVVGIKPPPAYSSRSA
jgi:gluconolactonase